MDGLRVIQQSKMATYKVIQDIEADDKLLGPLSLKQFIFAIVSAGFIFLAFITASKTHQLLTVIPYLPFIAVFGILAAPIGGYQSTDVWLAARIRFFLKPHKRVWHQSEIKNLVNITVPKKLEKIYTDGLNQDQVRSRLKVLADTLDSRGWAIKNADVNIAFEPDYINESADRLVSTFSLPQTMQAVDVAPSDDILDENSNHVAQNFSNMVAAAEKAQRDAIIEKMNRLRNETHVSEPKEDIAEKEMIAAILEKKVKNDEVNRELNHAHHKSINPIATPPSFVKIAHQPMTAESKPAIVNEVNTKKIVTHEVPSSQLTEANGDVVINLR